MGFSAFAFGITILFAKDAKVNGRGLVSGIIGKKNRGVMTTFSLNSSTQITATVPTGAKTGKIHVATPGGTAASPTALHRDPMILWGKRSPCTVLLSVHERVQWTLVAERS